MALRIAYFGQAPFGRDVLVRLLEAGHEIAGVYAPPTSPGARADPLAGRPRGAGSRSFATPRCARRRGGDSVAHHRARRAARRPERARVRDDDPAPADRGRPALRLALLPSVAAAEIPRRQRARMADHRARERVGRQRVQARRRHRHRPHRRSEGSRRRSSRTTLRRASTSSRSTRSGSRRWSRRSGASRTAPRRTRRRTRRARATRGWSTTSVARIDWSRSAAEIDRLVRGCDPNPGAHRAASGQSVRLFGCRRLYTSRRIPNAGARQSVAWGRRSGRVANRGR